MSKSNLNYVEIQGVRSIVGPCRIEFPKSGLVLIKGKNADTGASSGSGKSSVLHAINFALGTGHIPASRLENWNTPISVSLSVSSDEKTFLIERGTKVALTGDIQAKGATSVNEELSKALGVTPAQLQSLTNRPQKKKSFFLSKSDEEKKSFLIESIPLIGKFEDLAQDSEVRIQKLSALVDVCESQLNQELAVMNSIIVPDFTPLDTSEHSQKLKEVLQQVSDLLASKAELQVQIDGVQTYDPPETEEMVQIKAEIAKWEPILAEAQKRLLAAVLKEAREKSESDKRIENANTFVKVASALLEKEKRAKEDKAPVITQSIKILEDSRCPTCEQPWSHTQKEIEKQKLKLQELDQAVLSAEIGLVNGKSALAAIVPFVSSDNTKGLEVVRDQIKAQISDWKDRLQLLNVELARSSLKLSRDLQVKSDEISGRISDLNSKSLDLKMKISEAEIRHSASEKTRLIAVVSKDKYSKIVQESGEKLDSAKKDLGKESDFLEAVGRTGFLGAIFDEILSEISSEANSILGQIPNTYGMTINLRSESITQSGKTKKSISTAVTIDGHESNSKDGPSGGQESVLELAVDLAVSRVIRRRTGSSPSWLFLDEPFEGLGVIEKEAFLSILQKQAQDTLVVVIDHATETQEFFDKIVQVEYKSGVSHVHT